MQTYSNIFKHTQVHREHRGSVLYTCRWSSGRRTDRQVGRQIGRGRQEHIVPPHLRRDIRTDILITRMCTDKLTSLYSWRLFITNNISYIFGVLNQTSYLPCCATLSKCLPLFPPCYVLPTRPRRDRGNRWSSKTNVKKHLAITSLPLTL